MKYKCVECGAEIDPAIHGFVTLSWPQKEVAAYCATKVPCAEAAAHVATTVARRIAIGIKPEPS